MSKLTEFASGIEHAHFAAVHLNPECRRGENELREKFPDVDEWAEELESLPSSKNELEDLASEKKYKAKMLTCNNPDAMASYEQLQVQVSSLESQLESRKAEFEQVRAQVEQTKVRLIERADCLWSQLCLTGKLVSKAQAVHQCNQ